MRPTLQRDDRRAASSLRSYPVAAPHPFAFAWIALPLLIAATGVPLLRLLQGEPRPGTGIALWLTPLLLLVVTGMAYRRRRITLDADALQITAMLYRKRIELGAMDLDTARIVDFAEHTELKPGRKTNSFAIPGVRAGHFRLHDGSKVFCLITDSSRVLVLPLRDGSRVLLSPEQPRQLLQDLTRLAARERRD
ncbi:MAG: PH domain-containing protein [Stenotrophomonas sp.]